MSLPKPFHVEGQGLVLAGHAEGLKDPRERSRQWLVEQGASPFLAEQATEMAPVTLAWWGGDEVGFVGQEHAQAAPVTVVQVPDGRQ